MLTLHGHHSTFCDGVSRRSALQVGSLGLAGIAGLNLDQVCLLYTSPSPRDGLLWRMPSSG